MGDWRITNNASKVETEERKDFWFCCRSPSWYVCVPRIDFCVCPFIRRLRRVQLAKIAARGSVVQVADQSSCSVVGVWFVYCAMSIDVRLDL